MAKPLLANKVKDNLDDTRNDQDEKEYFNGVDKRGHKNTLALLAGQEMLTPDGLSLLADIRMLREMTGGRYGILTELGALEHRQICGRMYRHYKKVFSDKERQAIYASATHVGRVRKSMEAFTDELPGKCPPWKSIRSSII